jgi:hypothetical protein
MPVCLARLLLGSVLLLAAPGCRVFTLSDPAEKAEAQVSAPTGKPSRFTRRIAPYVFLSDTDPKNQETLFKELAELRNQVCHELQLPASERPILVYLFESQDRYERYMAARYPQLPRRRAFFIAQPRMGGEDLTVYTYWGPRTRQDLRHELTHALLHSVLKGVPQWLDEGLAEYFEQPPQNSGVNDSHLNHIRRSVVDPFRPDLARLEGLEQVKDMSPAEYREAWAWTHFMLRGDKQSRVVLLSYLRDLRSDPTPGSLRTRLGKLMAAPEESLRRYLITLEFAPTGTTSVRR